MKVKNNPLAARRRRQLRARRKIFGAVERPRLCVTKSSKHMYAQIINDELGHTLVAASTREAVVAEGLSGTGNVEAARKVGLEVGRRAVEKGITSIVFDRAGWPYHGRIKAVADGAREAGLEF